MWEVKELRQLCKTAWGKQHEFVIILILAVKNTKVSMCKVGLTSFAYQIKLKIKIIIIFSLQEMENLKQIVNNTEPKRSFSFVVGDNKTRFKIWFKPPIQLDKKKDEIALINLETYYSFSSIDRSNNCFTYLPNLDPLWFDI